MLTDSLIPFINENLKMKDALKVLNKKLGLLVRNKRITTGIITDGELRKFSQKNQNINNTLLKIITKNHIGIDKMIKLQALSLMNNKKITLCVYSKKINSKL